MNDGDADHQVEGRRKPTTALPDSKEPEVLFKDRRFHHLLKTSQDETRWSVALDGALLACCAVQPVRHRCRAAREADSIRAIQPGIDLHADYV